MAPLAAVSYLERLCRDSIGIKPFRKPRVGSQCSLPIIRRVSEFQQVSSFTMRKCFEMVGLEATNFYFWNEDRVSTARPVYPSCTYFVCPPITCFLFSLELFDGMDDGSSSLLRPIPLFYFSIADLVWIPAVYLLRFTIPILQKSSL